MTTEVTIRSPVWMPGVSRSQNAQAIWTAAIAAIEVLVIAASTYGAFAAYNLVAYGVVPDRVEYEWAAVVIGAMYGGICVADNQYDLLGPEWNQHSRSRGLAAVGLAFLFMLTLGFTIDSLDGYSRGTFMTQLVVASVAQLVTRTILWQVVDHARRRGNWRRAGMVVLTMPGANRATDMGGRLSTRCEEILRCYDLGAAIDESFLLEGLDRRLVEIARECRILQVDAVLILFDADNMRVVARVVSALSELPVRIQLLPIGMADLMQRSRVGTCGRMSVLELVCGPCSLRDRVLKRATDIAAAITLGIMVLPLLVIVSILIKLDSKGPVLFRQVRHGFNNEPIRVLKFRTMTTFDDSPQEFRQAVRGDSRVTRIGRILRRTNIDELPQLINVLKGEMSMVGPRPHAVAHNQMYADQICRMSRRHNVKPGITGWAQVNGFRGETDTIEKMQKRVEYDLYYVDNWTLVFDLKIMIMTVLSKSAYANAY